MSNKEMSFKITSNILNKLDNDKLIKNYTNYNKFIVDYLLQNYDYLFKYFIDYFENKYNYLDFYNNEEVIDILLTKTSIDELYYMLENNSCSYYMLPLLSNI